MKAELFDIKGNRKGEINLPKLFAQKIREDIAAKYFEASKFEEMQPYSNDPGAGRKASASGTISHKRHDWKGHYGKGISRAPRKTMWRRGTQFFWIGAEASGTRGGRRVHGPTLYKNLRKINKKEISLAMHSALAATAHKSFIKSRYSSLEDFDFKPIAIESKLDSLKAREFMQLVKKILGQELFAVALKKKSVRAGKGKLRGRKYKANAGLLLVTGKEEKIRLTGVEVRNTKNIRISDLYPLGRLTIYTEKSLEELK